MTSRLAWIVAIAVAGTTIAQACPPGPCLKYRRTQPPMTRAVALTYVRSVRAQPPSNPRAIAAFLTGSLWLPLDQPPRPNVLPALPIHFVDARQIKTSPARADERVVLVRRIDRRDRTSMVEVDGQVFELTRCRDANHWTSCLTVRTDLSFDEIEDDDGHFAQPPP